MKVFVVLLGLLSTVPVVLAAEPITHGFLATGGDTIIVDSEDGITWQYPHSSRDGWVLPNGNILLALSKSKSYPSGAVVEVNRDKKVIFEFKGGGGVDANLKRQLAVFQPGPGKEKVEDKQEKIKVGPNDAVLQEVSGTFLKKAGGPFDPNAKTTPVPNYKQVYVVFETKDGVTASAWLRGPAKTVDQNRAAFESWVKNFK